MKKLTISLLCFFIAISFCNAQWNKGSVSGNGVMANETRDLKEFTRFSVGSGIDVYVHQANTHKVEIEAEENIIPVILTEVRGGELKIYLEKSVHTKKRMVLNLWMTDIESISASGGSDVYSKGTITAKSIKLRASGGADLEMALDVDRLDCTVSGGSDADLSGRVGSCEMHASGGSDIKAYELKASVCNVSASGGSDAYVTATEEINLSASGGSDVYYKGDAKIGRKSVSGSSDVHH